MKLKDKFQNILKQRNINANIKSCSFCTSDQIDLIYVHTGAEVYYIVECQNCKNHIHTQQKDILKIANIWNNEN